VKTGLAPGSHRFCVAPMMEWTDRHCRAFLRRLSRHVRLYTEMVTSAAIVHGDRDRLLGFDASEHPVALQLGGSDPRELAESARIGEQYGYDEINLNCGCPSDRVQSGRFGACLMAEPALVARCIEAMREAVVINQGQALLEASGGISLESIRAVAATGVDRISVGSITKDVKATDFSLRVTARHDPSAG